MSRKNIAERKNMPSERKNSGQKPPSQRIAAENELLDQLRSLLPMPEDAKPDKLSVLRLVIAYMKNRQDLSDIIASSARLSLTDSIEDSDEDLEGEDDFTSYSEGDGTQKDLACSADITLPDALVSHIEQQLASREEKEDDEEFQEKIMKYKEGLERGINDFLQQSLPGEAINLDRNKFLPEQRAVAKLNSDTRKKSLFKQERYELPKEGDMALEAINGFVVVLAPDLTVTYISHNVAQYLGHCPFSVMGQNIELFLHPKDFKRLQQFRDEIMKEDHDKTKEEMGIRATFYMATRFCFQTALARLKSTGFSTIKWNISCRYHFDFKSGISKLASFVCICQLHHTESVMDIKLGGTMYVSRHNFDSTYTHCEPNVLYLTGYTSDEIVSSGINIIHCCCFGVLKKKKKKESSTSGYYRFLTRDGYWLWMQSQLRTVYSAKGEAQFIESRNHVIRVEEVMQSFDDNLRGNTQGKKAVRHSHTTSPSTTKALKNTDVGDANVQQDNKKANHGDMIVPNVGRTSEMRFPHGEIPMCKTVLSQFMEYFDKEHSSVPAVGTEWQTEVKRENPSPESTDSQVAMEILDPFADVQDVLPDCDFNATDLNPFKDVDDADFLQSLAGHDILHATVKDTLNNIPLPEYNNFNSPNNSNSSELQGLTQRPLSDPSPSLPPEDLKEGENSMLEMEIVLKNGLGIYEIGAMRSPVTQAICRLGESHPENDRLSQDLNLISSGNSINVGSTGNLFPAMGQSDTWTTEGTTVIEASNTEMQTIPSFGDEMILDCCVVESKDLATNVPQNLETSPFMDSSGFPDSPYTSSISSVNNQSDSEGSTSFLKFSPSSQLTMSDQDLNPDMDHISDIPPDLTDLNVEQCCHFASCSGAPLDNDRIFDVYLN